MTFKLHYTHKLIILTINATRLFISMRNMLNDELFRNHLGNFFGWMVIVIATSKVENVHSIIC